LANLQPSPFPDIVHEAALVQDIPHDRRQRVEVALDAPVVVDKQSFIHPEFHEIALLDPGHIADDGREPDIDGVPVENPREGWSDDCVYAGELDEPRPKL
jgi:hypothetical protein